MCVFGDPCIVKKRKTRSFVVSTIAVGGVCVSACAIKVGTSVGGIKVYGKHLLSVTPEIPLKKNRKFIVKFYAHSI